MLNLPIGRGALEAYDWVLSRIATLLRVGSLPLLVVITLSGTLDYLMLNQQWTAAAVCYFGGTPFMAMLAVRWSRCIQGKPQLSLFRFGKPELQMLLLGLLGVAIMMPGRLIGGRGLGIAYLNHDNSGYLLMAAGAVLIALATIVGVRLAPLVGHIAAGHGFEVGKIWRMTRHHMLSLVAFYLMTNVPLLILVLDFVVADTAEPTASVVVGTLVTALVFTWPIVTSTVAYRMLTIAEADYSPSHYSSRMEAVPGE